MGRIISFSRFESYLEKSKSLIGFLPVALVDTNILIDLTDDQRPNHDIIVQFWDNQLLAQNITPYATLTSRSEYLEFWRRANITDTLLDAIDEEVKTFELPPSVRSKIQSQKAQLNRRRKERTSLELRSKEFLNDSYGLYFYDREIKQVKRSFLAMGKEGMELCTTICNEHRQKLSNSDQELRNDAGVHYVSPNEETDFFGHHPSWKRAIEIAENSYPNFSDAMFLNALEASRAPFAISSDFDLAFAVLQSDKLRDVVMPDAEVEKVPTEFLEA